MKSLATQAVIGLLLAVLLFCPVLASAQNLDSQLERMFTSFGVRSSVAGAGAFQGQTRNALVGGSLQMRWNTEPTPLFSFSAPRMNAGCGGVDVYLGSFSYGSLNRYVQLLQQIGTGVVLGYAFQLAMKAICPDCADVLNKLEAAARALNTATRLGPCSSAAEIQKSLENVGKGMQEVANSTSNAWMNYRERLGLGSDIHDAKDTETVRPVADAVAGMAGSNDTRIHGNLVWDVLSDNTGGKIPPPIDERRLLMSLFGTVIVGQDGIAVPRVFTLTYDELIKADALNDVTVYTCVGGTGLGECLDVTKDTATISGFDERTRANLSSIVNKLDVKAALDANDLQFVRASPVPAYGLMMRFARTHEDRDYIANISAPIVSKELAHAYIKNAYKEIRQKLSDYKKLVPNWGGDIGPFIDHLNQVMQQSDASVANLNGSLANLHNLPEMAKKVSARPPRRY